MVSVRAIDRSRSCQKRLQIDACLCVSLEDLHNLLGNFDLGERIGHGAFEQHAQGLTAIRGRGLGERDASTQVEGFAARCRTLDQLVYRAPPAFDLVLGGHRGSVSSGFVYSRVALPTAVPEPLTYRIPDRFVGLACPGVRVKVPLRRAAKVGLVVELTDDPGCAPERVVEIDEVLDPEPLLPGAVLELIRFAASYYAAPLGTVVRAALPSQFLKLPSPLIELGARAAEIAASASGDRQRLLERLLEARRISVARLLTEGWDRERLAEIVTELEGRHAVVRIERRPLASAGRTVGAVTLADLADDERRARVGRAQAQQRVVSYLEELGHAAVEGELRAACEVSPGVITALVRKGVLRRFRQRRNQPHRRWELSPPPPVTQLTDHQQGALDHLRAAVSSGGYGPVLLRGVTGSGKTEVYLRLAEETVARGMRVLVLVPEIGLTPQLAGQLAVRFGERVAVLHSSMSDGDRLAAWDRSRRGEVDVVVGPRSALWAPLSPVGLVVVDEEQDPSYKQDEEPRYHARDLALVLAKNLEIPAVLASATPSLETLALVAQGKASVVDLPERVAGGKLPEVEVLDLRGLEGDPGEHGLTLFSPRLKELLRDRLARQEQAILLVNRRGWAPVLLCRECGHRATCRDCSIAMTVHRRQGQLVCHFCGFSRAIPDRCRRCGGAVLAHVGAGTEKAAARVRELFPEARVDILDRDTARSPARLLGLLERFAAGGSDILVGTQMVSKGHHFPKVTLTAVLNCDNLLGFPDFRGAERTFQLLTQVAGRAGRGERPGKVLFQSYHPDHYAIVAAAAHDVDRFAAEELRYRAAFRYPPYQRLALIRLESEREAAAWRAAEAIAVSVEPPPDGARVVGPAAAPLARLRGRFRVQILIFAATRAALRAALDRATTVSVQRSVRRVVDVDPQSTV